MLLACGLDNVPACLWVCDVKHGVFLCDTKLQQPGWCTLTEVSFNMNEETAFYSLISCFGDSVIFSPRSVWTSVFSNRRVSCKRKWDREAHQLSHWAKSLKYCILFFTQPLWMSGFTLFLHQCFMFTTVWLSVRGFVCQQEIGNYVVQWKAKAENNTLLLQTQRARSHTH